MTYIPTTLPSTSSSTVATSSGKTPSADELSFLKMLTTELQHQDPTSPMDTTGFTQQLIGFSQIQQQADTNTNLKSLIASTKSASVSNAVSYVDRFAQVQSSDFNLANNNGFISYNLPTSAASVNVSITDDTGKVVSTFSGATTKGIHDYTWVGKDASGKILADGKYHMNVTAKDAKGVDITDIPTYTTGLVTAVDLDNGVTTLHLGDLIFTTDQIYSIKSAYSDSPTSTSPTSPSTPTTATTATTALSTGSGSATVIATPASNPAPTQGSDT